MGSWEKSRACVGPVVIVRVLLLAVMLEETTVFAAMVLQDKFVSVEVIANRAYRAKTEHAPAHSTYSIAQYVLRYRHGTLHKKRRKHGCGMERNE